MSLHRPFLICTSETSTVCTWHCDIALDIVSWIHVSPRRDLLWQGEDKCTNPADRTSTIFGLSDKTLTSTTRVCWDMQIWFISRKAGIHLKLRSFRKMFLKIKCCVSNTKPLSVNCGISIIVVHKWDSRACARKEFIMKLKWSFWWWYPLALRASSGESCVSNRTRSYAHIPLLIFDFFCCTNESETSFFLIHLMFPPLACVIVFMCKYPG